MTMSKRKKKQLFIIIGAAAVLTAVVALIIYFHNRVDYSKYATTSLKDIIANSEIPTKNYDNLDFSNAVLNLPDADKAYKLYRDYEHKFSYEECSQKCFDMFETFFSNLKEDNGDLSYVATLSGEPLPKGKAEIINDVNGQFAMAALGYTANDGKYYECRFEETGRFTIFEESAVGKSVDGKAEIIHLDRGEKIPDKNYLVGGEEYSPKQATEYAQKFMSEKISKFVADVDISPTEFIIIDDPESDNYVYKIQFEYVYEGIPYFHLSRPRAIEENKSIQYGVIFVTIGAPDSIDFIYNVSVYPEAKNDGEYEDKYIPLDTAADLVNEYLAPYFKQHISEVTIKYSYDYLNKSQKYLRPYWCFIIDIDNPMYGDVCLTENAIFIDMQTGEIVAHIDVSKGYN